jgi:outer membrane protein assembly complex protein YaeT
MRALILLAVLAVAGPVRAQSSDGAGQPAAAKYAGRVVSNVRVLTEGRDPAEPVLLEFIQTRRGEPLAIAAVRDSIAHLFSLGRFEDVRVDAVEAAGGVELTYNVIPLHTVDEVEYEGDLGLSKGLLRRTIRERYGASPRPGRQEDMARTLAELYRDRGYFLATIKPVATVRHDPDETRLTFHIDAGPRARIGDISIEGDTVVPRPEFLNRVGVSPGDPYERPEVQQHLDDFVERLRQRGYYEATGTHRATTSADALVADLRFDVHAGPAVTVTFEGDPLSRDKLDDLVTIRREGSVDEDLLEDIDRRIADYLHQQGYWKASVTHARQEDGDSRLAIVFRIRRGLLYRLAGEVEITGNRSIAIERLRPLVTLEPGDVFIESRLDAALNAIRDLYRRDGFATAKIEPAVNETDAGRPGEGAVQPRIIITEGPRTVTGDILIAGNSRIQEAELRPLIRSSAGTAFYAPQVAADRDAVLFEYLNRGFASAAVNVSIVPAKDATRTDIRFDIREGPQTIVDHVLIVGNTRTQPHIIQRELLLRTGEPLGLRDLAESQRRLSSLGLFRRVRITEMAHGSSTRRDVLVTVEEAAATTVEYGGGLEGSRILRATGPEGEAQDEFEVAPRGFFDIGRRNLWGKNRSVHLYTRLALRPSGDVQDEAGNRARFGFSEYRVVGSYRQPRLLGPNDATLTAAVEQGVRSSFNFARKGVTAEALRRLTSTMRASIRYSFGTTRIFDERFAEEDSEDQARIDRIFPQVRLSTFSGAIARDTRDDLSDPARGMFLSAEGSVAARSLGGQVGFMKTYLQGFWFRQLPMARRVIFASRVAAGIADGFAREVTTTGPDGLPETQVVEDLPASERFFAGGDTTIRGFALDSVGAEGTITSAGFPRGGNAVLILNGELRIPVWGGLGTALFIDGGNVFGRVSEFDFGDLRGAAGIGVRYHSPIGPVRVDVGFKLDQRPTDRRRREIHFSIGHAF